MAQNGKGSKPRPLAVDRDTYAENWDRIFAPKPRSTKCARCGKLFVYAASVTPTRPYTGPEFCNPCSTQID